MTGDNDHIREFIRENILNAAFENLMERSHRIVQIQKDDDGGYNIIEPEDGQKLADPAEVKHMGRDRRLWLYFFKEHGVEFVVMKGMGRGGADKELSTQRFLDSVIEPPKGNVIPIIKGTPAAPPPEKVSHAPVSGDIMGKEKEHEPEKRSGNKPLGRIKLAQRRV